MAFIVIFFILTVGTKGYGPSHIQDFTTNLADTLQNFQSDDRHLTTDIYNYTDVMIKAQVIDNESVNLICSSTAIPFGHNAEFLINNRSEDTMRFDPRSNLCYNNAALCSGDICNCSDNGNTFMMVFKHTQKNSIYSCDMVFMDEKFGSKIQKVASVFVNSTGVYNLPTTTIVIRQQFQNSTEPPVISGSTTEPTNRTVTFNGRKDEVCLEGAMIATITAYFCGFLVSLLLNYLLLHSSRLHCCLKILFRIEKIRTILQKPISAKHKVMKKILFGLLSVVIFAILYSIAKQTDVCKFLWLFGALGFFIGCVLTVLLMTEIDQSSLCYNLNTAEVDYTKKNILEKGIPTQQMRQVVRLTYRSGVIAHACEDSE